MAARQAGPTATTAERPLRAKSLLFILTAFFVDDKGRRGNCSYLNCRGERGGGQMREEEGRRDAYAALFKALGLRDFHYLYL